MKQSVPTKEEQKRFAQEFLDELQNGEVREDKLEEQCIQLEQGLSQEEKVGNLAKMLCKLRCLPHNYLPLALVDEVILSVAPVSVCRDSIKPGIACLDWVAILPVWRLT